MEKKKEIWTLKASRDYRKEKAKKLAIELEYYKKKAKYLELAVKIWSEWHSELIAGQNYEKQFENGIAKYDLEIDKNWKVINGWEYRELC